MKREEYKFIWENQCGDCMFYVKGYSNRGICKRHPITVNVDSNEWCGEFGERESHIEWNTHMRKVTT